MRVLVLLRQLLRRLLRLPDRRCRRLHKERGVGPGAQRLLCVGLVAAARLLPDLSISASQAKRILRVNPQSDRPWRLSNSQVRRALEQARQDLERAAWQNAGSAFSPQAWAYVLNLLVPEAVERQIPPANALGLQRCTAVCQALRGTVRGLERLQWRAPHGQPLSYVLRTAVGWGFTVLLDGHDTGLVRATCSGWNSRIWDSPFHPF